MAGTATWSCSAVQPGPPVASRRMGSDRRAKPDAPNSVGAMRSIGRSTAGTIATAAAARKPAGVHQTVQQAEELLDVR